MRLAPPLILAALLGLLVHPAAAEGLAFVLNSGSASVSLVDVATGREVRRIPVLREPHHMALTPDHRALLVGDSAGNELLFFDPRSGALERRMPLADPYQLQFSPDGRWLVVTGLARNQIDLYDAATMQLVKRFPAATMPSHINFSPDSTTVFVSLQGTNDLIAIDIAARRVRWKMPVGNTPAGVLWHDGRVLVGIMGAAYVAVVDPRDGRVVEKVHTGRGAHVLFVPPDGRVIYATNRVDGTISVLDATTLKELRVFKVPGGPDDIDFAPDGKLWITRRFAHSVAVLDPKTGDFTTIEVGRSPHGIWLNTHDHLGTTTAAR
jgi:YVTN family beta-propeller protein